MIASLLRILQGRALMSRFSFRQKTYAAKVKSAARGYQGVVPDWPIPKMAKESLVPPRIGERMILNNQ